jgi:RHS repeat-associated protein
MVRSIVNGVVTYYPSAQYQQTVSNGTTSVQKTYVFGSLTVAVRTNGTLSWVLTDQISSTTVTASATGDLNSEIRYTAFGTIRYQNGVTPTDYRYTGQLQQAVIGLYYYNARWYDPQLGRFVQADTIVANPYAAVSYDRFSYVSNNPINLSDPSGNIACWDEHENDLECQGKTVTGNGIVPKVDNGGVGSGYSYKGAYGQGTDSGQVAASNFAKKVVNGYVSGWKYYYQAQYICAVAPTSGDRLAGCGYSGAWMGAHEIGALGAAMGVIAAWQIVAAGGTICEVDTGCGNGVIHLYRSVSEAELNDIMDNHIFQPAPAGNSMDAKWFWQTLEGAKGWAKTLPDMNNVMDVTLPKDILDFSSSSSENLDNLGPAVSFLDEGLDMLNRLIISITQK